MSSGPWIKNARHLSLHPLWQASQLLKWAYPIFDYLLNSKGFTTCKENSERESTDDKKKAPLSYLGFLSFLLCCNQALPSLRSPVLLYVGTMILNCPWGINKSIHIPPSSLLTCTSHLSYFEFLTSVVGLDSLTEGWYGGKACWGGEAG